MDKESKTLFLHIGLPKTGSTSIQEHLLRNQRKLRDKGILYPTPLVSVGHHAESLLILREVEPEFIYYWHRIATKAADSKRGNTKKLLETINQQVNSMEQKDKILIISSEGIFEAFPNIEKISLFTNFFPNYKIKIILYLRRIDAMVESAVMEYIKNNEPISDQVINKIMKFRVDQQLKIPMSLKLWEDLIGKDNIIVRPFEREQLVGNEVIKDFMSIITPLPIHDEGENATDNNSSISIEGAYFLKETVSYPSWNRSPKDGFIGSVIVSSERLRKISQYKGALLSPKVRLELINRLRSTYDKLKIYLSKENRKNLFIGPLPGENDKWEPFNGLNFENTKPIYDEIINTLYKKFEYQQKEIANLQNNLDKKVSEIQALRNQLS
jgi:hypothetical protein